MREFVFTIEYETGADEVMDLFIDHGDLYARSMEINATSEAVWGIDKVVGPTTVLNDLDDRLERVASDPNTTGMCGAPVTEYEYTILSSNAESRKIYSLRQEGAAPRSIPLVAANHVGEGLIMRSERRGDQFRWRLLLDEPVTAIHEDIRTNLREGLSLTVERLGTPPCLLEDGRVQQTLTPEQKAALEAAIEHGYYEEPRQQSVTEIAAAVDVSRSTFQYRLNRAEAWLAQQFAADSLDVDLDVDLDPEDIEFIQ
ncbi:helix-turn-helix domain-containing protein [Halalkalicoccus jeotgali]|uniref:Transcription regulator n=1 Tax=Halalkalicoccus jeotgali (strain DSM 18796 / CECT 7217 / JCM 14584 / KCTC 4019 / B3) TaxID=795797 RepID=D8JBP2_HALJB|nr:helix-turn-helix domain-containing protein [Halalkalicoccus jeotgali]ADJ16695.1 transcription regulator [Halalkalicoccus jeotgali B3]ELY40826.1 transcriptional regulator [Halalkalicoccus jeotgali B3]